MSGSTTTTNNKRQFDEEGETVSEAKRLRATSQEQASPKATLAPDASESGNSNPEPIVPSSPVSSSAPESLAPKKTTRRKRATTTRKPNRYRGICWLPDRQSWRARIEIGGKREHLGYFRSPEEAAHSYDHRAVEHYGAAVGFLNFPSNHPHYACARPSTFLPGSALAQGSGSVPHTSSPFGAVDMPVYPQPPSMLSVQASMPMNASAKMWGNVMDASSSSGSSSPSDLAHGALRDLLNVSRELQQAQMRYQHQQHQQQQQHKTSSSDVLSRMLAVENNKRYMQTLQTNVPQHDPLALQRIEAEMQQRTMEQRQRQMTQDLARQLQLQQQVQASRMSYAANGSAYAPMMLPNFAQRPMVATSAALHPPSANSVELSRLHNLMMLNQQNGNRD